jgi:signal transduction histidine kinase
VAELTLARDPDDGLVAMPIERSAWRAVVQFLPHAVLLLDADLRVIVANKAATRLFRRPGARLRGVRLCALLPGSHVSRWLAAFGGQRRNVIEASVEIAGAGAPITLKIVAARLASRARGSFHLLVLEDISDRAALEHQLVQSEKQAAMGQLAAGILHEVANPIAGLGSNLVFVRDGLDDRPRASIEQALDVSLEQLHQMRQLLGTLSGFPGPPPPAVETENLFDVVQRAVEFVRNEAERRLVHIELSLDAPAIVCEMDTRLIRQVLLNVLKNAMDAMPQGGRIDVRASSRDRRPDGAGAAIVEIRDSGVGIAESDLRKVFRPLFSTKPRGAGLGLSFCRQAVEEHGGRIRVASAGLRHGTAVTISLPLRQAAALDDEE